MMAGFLLGFCFTLALSLCLLHSKRKLVVRIKPELRDVQEAKSGTPTVGGIAFTVSTTVVSLLLHLSPVGLLAMWLWDKYANGGFIENPFGVGVGGMANFPSSPSNPVDPLNWIGEGFTGTH